MSVINTDVSNSITNLLTMNSTVATVAKVSAALEALPKSETTATQNNSSSDEKFTYDTDMDYNKDGAVSIGERLTYYTLQLGAQLSDGASPDNSSSNISDIASLLGSITASPPSTSSSSNTNSSSATTNAAGLKTAYEEGQAAINQKLIESAYSSSGAISGFSIKV